MWRDTAASILNAFNLALSENQLCCFFLHSQHAHLSDYRLQTKQNNQSSSRYYSSPRSFDRLHCYWQTQPPQSANENHLFFLPLSPSSFCPCTLINCLVNCHCFVCPFATRFYKFYVLSAAKCIPCYGALVKVQEHLLTAAGMQLSVRANLNSFKMPVNYSSLSSLLCFLLLWVRDVFALRKEQGVSSLHCTFPRSLKATSFSCISQLFTAAHADGPEEKGHFQNKVPRSQCSLPWMQVEISGNYTRTKIQRTHRGSRLCHRKVGFCIGHDYLYNWIIFRAPPCLSSTSIYCPLSNCAVLGQRDSSLVIFHLDFNTLLPVD